jgi:hypothetical protein
MAGEAALPLSQSILLKLARVALRENLNLKE